MLRAARLAHLSRVRLRPLPLRALAASPGGADGRRRQSPYERLGVTPKASLAEVKQAFYKKAKDCHPDMHGQDPAMAAEFRELAEAYDLLSDPETRQKYEAAETGDGPEGCAWRPGDGWSAEEMEGNKRWREVINDREVLKQAREEYVQELRRDLQEACGAALKGDLSRLRAFVWQYPGAVAGGLVVALPVLLAVRSPYLFVLAIKRLALVEALATKAIISFMVPWCAAMSFDLPGRIWDARVAAAKRSIRRREAAAEKREAERAAAGAGAEAAAAAGETLGRASDGSDSPAPAAAEREPSDAVARSEVDAVELPEVTSQVPNTLYLDDSTSMIHFRIVPDGAFSLGQKYRWEKTCLEAGKKELIELAHYLQGTPTRVVKFGGIVEEHWYHDQAGERACTRIEKMFRTLVHETMSFKKDSELPLLLNAWDGSSQGTYMWKMIETDITGTYRPGSTVRVHLITDGEDTHSPGEYRGINGMDVLMESLHDKGYKIQWNIILLLFGAHSFHGLAARRYEQLCISSGGIFQVISDGYSNSGADADLRLFLDSYDADTVRRRYRDHLLTARTGKGDEVIYQIEAGQSRSGSRK